MMKVIKAETAELQQKAFDLRQEVFVGEQNVPADAEFDQYESECAHFVALEDDQAVGAARWRETEKGVKFERFAVKKTMRGKGVGSRLVELVLDDVRSKLGEGVLLYLHAQLPAVALYEKYGFEKKGDQFEECGIMHYHMFRKS